LQRYELWFLKILFVGSLLKKWFPIFGGLGLRHVFDILVEVVRPLCVLDGAIVDSLVHFPRLVKSFCLLESAVSVSDLVSILRDSAFKGGHRGHELALLDVLSLCPGLTSQCGRLCHLLEFLPRSLLLLESHELLGSE